MPKLNETHKAFNVQGAKKTTADNGDTVVTSLGSLVRPDESNIHPEFTGDDRPIVRKNPDDVGGLYIQEVEVDGGESATREIIDTKLLNPAFRDASMFVTTTEGKDGKLYYTQWPPTSVGNFTVTRNSPKWVLNKDGVLEEVPANTPAHEFNADGSYKGCLIEPSGTNLLEHPNKFDESDWSKTNLTVDEVDTFGDVKVWELKCTEFTESGGQLRQDINAPSNSDRTLSFIAKSGTHSRIQISFGSLRTSSAGAVIIELTNGSVIDINSDSRSTIEDVVIEPLQNNWYKIQVVGGAGTGLPGDDARRNRFNINIVNADATVATSSTSLDFDSTGNETIFIATTQAELGVVGTSFILPEFGTGGETTRNADVITKDDAEDLIGQDEGTIYLEGAWLGLPDVDAAGACGLKLGTSASNFRGIAFGMNNTGDLRLDTRNTSGSTSSSLISYNFGDIIKLSITYDYNGQAPNTTVAGGLKLYINGTLSQTLDLRVPAEGQELTQIRFLGGVVGTGSDSRLSPQQFKTISLFKTAKSPAQVNELLSEPTFELLAESLTYTIYD